MRLVVGAGGIHAFVIQIRVKGILAFYEGGTASEHLVPFGGRDFLISCGPVMDEWIHLHQGYFPGSPDAGVRFIPQVVMRDPLLRVVPRVSSRPLIVKGGAFFIVQHIEIPKSTSDLMNRQTEEEIQMVIILEPHTSAQQVEHIKGQIQTAGAHSHTVSHHERTLLVVGGSKPALERVRELTDSNQLGGLDRVAEPTHGFQLASREVYPDSTVINVNGVAVGGNRSVVIAGPCAVEGRDQILEAAHQVKLAGATMLRGGAYKPRSSPYSFQGMAEAGLQLLAEAREATGLPVVTEIIDADLLPMMQDYVDVFQVGARNMQNYALLKELGNTNKPVLLKRGMSATIEEWLMAAEYVLSHGNPNVILCERGIRTFETYTRNTFDLNAVAVAKHLSHLPVIADPSHGTGVARYVTPMSLAAIAAGADGLIIEVHPQPEVALSDGKQSLNPDDFSALMRRVQLLGEAVGSPVPAAAPATTNMAASDLSQPIQREPVKMK